MLAATETMSLEVSSLKELIFKHGMKLRDIEQAIILETLKSQGFNRTHAARLLGIGIRTLQRKLKKYGVAGIGLSDKYKYLIA